MSSFDTLADLGMDHLSSRALAALPLVEVAWADGQTSASEVDRIVREAEASLGLGEDGALLLADWLRFRPSDAYFDAGRRLLRELAVTPGSGIDASMLKRVLALAVDVANAARGWLRYLFGLRAAEKRVLSRIERELTELMSAPPTRQAVANNATMLASGVDLDDDASVVGVVIVGAGESRAKHIVSRDGLLLGSGVDATVRLSGAGVTPSHARVFERRRRFYVASVGGAKVAVRGELIGERRLLGGETIKLGDVEVVFKMARRA